MIDERIRIRIDGIEIEVRAGTTVAAAVMMAGHQTFRRSVGGEGRSPLCGMGICFECRVSLDGRAHSRSCLIDCRPGMDVRTDGFDPEV